MSFDEYWIRVNEYESKQRQGKQQVQTGGWGGRGQRTVYIAGIGIVYRYYTYTSPTSREASYSL